MKVYQYKDLLNHSGIKGMKWGVRRYQNKDGSLTPAGKSRYERDQRENRGKKKGDKVGESDPNRWVREDIERSRKLTESGSQMVRDLQNINNKRSKYKQSKIDLSKMTDQEMRNKINRAILEKQYTDMFAQKKVNTGRELAGKLLDIGGSVLAVTGSALGIALSIKELRGK